MGERKSKKRKHAVPNQEFDGRTRASGSGRTRGYPQEALEDITSLREMIEKKQVSETQRAWKRPNNDDSRDAVLAARSCAWGHSNWIRAWFHASSVSWWGHLMFQLRDESRTSLAYFSLIGSTYS